VAERGSLVRTHSRAARFTRFSSSAPVKPSRSVAALEMSNCERACVLLARWILRIYARSGALGKVISILWSKRPGRRRASSRLATKLVAATTKIL